MILYDEKMLSAYSERIKKGSLLCVLPLAAALLFSVGMCFFISEDNGNADVIHVAVVVVNTLIGWFSLSVLLGLVLPDAKKKRITKRILSYAKKQISGKVVLIGDSLTVEGVKVTEIQIDSDTGTISVYYDTSFDAPDFHVGDKLCLTLSRNFIISYEVEGHE